MSADHNRIAFAVDLTGEEQYELYTKDTATGEVAQVTKNGDSSGSIAWATDSNTLFYVTLVGACFCVQSVHSASKPTKFLQCRYELISDTLHTATPHVDTVCVMHRFPTELCRALYCSVCSR